jgi:outer membrane immunogenic protein
MKKSIVALIAFQLGTMNLPAQDRADVSLNGSALAMSSATHDGITRDGSTTGGVLASSRFWVTPRNGFELNYGHANDTQTAKTGGSKSSLDSSVHEVSSLYVFRLKTTPHIQPFLGVGAAFLQFNPKNDSQFGPLPQSQNKPGLIYTAGLDYMFNQRFGARLQFRGLVFAAPSFMVESFRSNTMHHMSEPTFGFVYRFDRWRHPRS